MCVFLIKMLLTPWRGLAWLLLKNKIRKEFPTVKHLSTNTLGYWLEKNDRRLQIIDTRKKAEYEISHLPKAEHIPDIETAKQYLNPNEIIIAYCSVGYRSSRLAEQLQNLGYNQVWNLEGSIFQWANEKRILMKNNQPTQQVHPYSKNWKWLLKT